MSDRKLKFYSRSLSLGCMLLLLLAPFGAIGGGQDGGGGGVIRCEKSDGAIELQFRMVDGRKMLFKVPPKSSLPNGRDFELIDLWEAENGYGPFSGHRLTIPFNNKISKDIFIAKALDKLASVNAEFAEQIKYYHMYVTRRMEPVPANAYVIPPEDTDIRFLPRGCQPFGFGAYSDREDNLVYDPAIMASAPTIDQAAFEMHEAVYKYLRLTKGQQSSWQARHIVGLMFSNESFIWDDVTQGSNKN